ncbi:MAG: response regulator [Cyanobacteria bacterium SBLK]|nr:response regulator [Cyanobacteria bacterium SBLK]
MKKLERENILVIDDRPQNLKLLRNLLTKEGFKVRLSTNGEVAIKTAEYSPPDLILLDVMLPGIDGFETCRRIKQNPLLIEIPVIFMTGLNSIEDKIKGFEVGGIDYITKPFQLDEALIRIKTHLKIQNLQQQLSEQNQKLQTEIHYRQTVEITLRETQSNLEKTVEERTAQLKATNALLEQKIFDLQETEAVLQQALHSAESAARTKSEFLAKMSHELRTPLNAILGFTQILYGDRSSSADLQEKLKIIHENSEHLLDLINNILSIAQLDNSQAILRKNWFDLNYFLPTIINLFRPKAAQKGLTLELALTEEIPQAIQTDERKLRQVLINLLDNAISFTDRGYVRLQVAPVSPSHSKDDREPSLRISFSIEDTGQGISTHKIESLFQLFSQKKYSRFPEKGTGLGLFLCQEFVRLLGGEIKVTSTLNKGTIFSFEIPVCLQSSKVIYLDNDTRIKELFPLDPIEYRLLIADRRSENCQSLLEILEPLGFSVESTNEGQKCLQLWHYWQPHLILLDLHLPKLDRMGLLETIKTATMNQTTIAIALTGSASEEEWQEAMAIGCQDFISKPFREEVVLEKLAHHLGVLSRDRSGISLEEVEPLLDDLTREELAIMSAQWLQQFSDATRKIDRSRLRKLLQEIPSTDDILRQKIASLLDNFRFDILNQLID